MAARAGLVFECTQTHSSVPSRAGGTGISAFIEYPASSERSFLLRRLQAGLSGLVVGTGDDSVMLGSSVPVGRGSGAERVHEARAVHTTSPTKPTRIRTERL
jgi:hypothetical protein